MCMFQPDNMPRPGKSLIVHIKAARSLKVSFNDESKVSTPLFHGSRNSSIRGCKNTSMLFLGDLLPGMIIDRMKEVCFIHIQG